MELMYSLPQSKTFSQNLQQEQSIEKMLGIKLREMSNIILNYNNKTKIIKSVKYTIETNSDIVNTIPDFILARDAFCNKENILYRFYEDTRNNFLNITFCIAEALKEYGVMTDNNEIIEQGKVKKEQLLKMNDRELIFHGLAIFNFAKPYFQSLYQIGNLNNTISRIDNQQNFTCETVLEDGLSLIDSFNKILNEIKEFLCRTVDNLVNELKDKYPRFYIEYKSARIAASLESFQSNGSTPAWII